MPDPDPCCEHETQLDTAVRDLARAHGRPENAERIARGLPVLAPRWEATSENNAPPVIGYAPGA